MAEQTPVKSISTRLMTMKFMQRAAASDQSSPATPTADENGSGKRRKVSHTPVSDSPSTPLFDIKAAQSAIEEEEKRREAAVARLAQQLGDSHWVLDRGPKARKAPHKPLQVVQVGFAQIDSSRISDEDEETAVQGKDHSEPSRPRYVPAMSPAAVTEGKEAYRSGQETAAKKGQKYQAGNSDGDMSTSGSDSAEISSPRAG